MVKLDIITTRGGDTGDTSLGDGSRLRKDAIRVEAYGAVDEANAAIGVLRRHLAGDALADAMLARIQNDLFDLGADLCVPGTGTDRLRITDAQCLRLEAEVSAMNATIPPLASFVLPGGSAGAAQAHMARTIARRAERSMVALKAGEDVSAEALQYLNRLSDLLFIMARTLNRDAGIADVMWMREGMGEFAPTLGQSARS